LLQYAITATFLQHHCGLAVLKQQQAGERIALHKATKGRKHRTLNIFIFQLVEQGSCRHRKCNREYGKTEKP
jgi:hypothetical protein